ncbi:hypothetical protein [Prosthecobacter sp.]|uniref:anti-sigma factor family protein n=1 Tax=Prosthecobacter sp. TaxID=1965333 RepID=UPI002ABC7A7A|nr:hypothetical protein [Prosthecobacter sp.]MDZ4405832.1 hypothetical protein [Prosthecobacter sp.]
MKPESLHALIIDRHFGELTPEASELLELHLAQNADARAEAERILASLSVTHDAVLRHPELARVMPAPVEKNIVRAPRRSLVPSWLARAAVIALLAGTAGFFAGRSESRMATRDVESPTQTPHKESPWAKYRMSFDPAGEGMQVVRVDTEKLETKSLP